LGYLINVPKSNFFNELSEDEQKKYFSLTRAKFISAVDNIYYTVFLENDVNGSPIFDDLFARLDELRSLLLTTHVEQEFWNGLFVKAKGHKMYRYCLSVENEFDIFITDSLPNANTPRIFVQLRAYGLWNYGVDKMILKSYKAVEDLFAGQLGVGMLKIRENRIDYCYHTNIIVNPSKTLDRRYLEKYMKTTFVKGQDVWRIEKYGDNLEIKTEYLGMGDRSSNNIYARFYDKTKEVIDKGYKGMFFEIWYKNGLINQYDKYCYEGAYIDRSYLSIHKWKLRFYLEHGTDEQKKCRIRQALSDKNNNSHQFAELARAEGLPDLTVVMNIEYQTMRKFYYYSDNVIDALPIKARDNFPMQLNRIFKILDNKGLFIDFLTSNTLSFRKSKDVFCGWWERLRSVKLDSFKHNEPLIREYSTNLDRQAGKRRLIGAVATDAVYRDNIDTDFVEDVSDLLTNFNDNDMHDLKGGLRVDIAGKLDSFLLNDYSIKKQNKEVRLRSRKRKDELTLPIASKHSRENSSFTNM